MSPLYPAGIFGIKDKNDPLFGIMLDQIRLHPHPQDGCMQWCMMPIYMARMGMGEELYNYIEETVNRWLIFPNGLGADCPEGFDAARNRLRYNNVRELISNTRTQRSSYVFRHFDMETLPIVATAVSESLLQSYDGVLRICPAVPQGESVKFSLYGEGGFLVTVNIEDGKFRIIIENLRGENCYISLPDFMKDDCKAYIKNGDTLEKTKASKVEYRGEEVVTFQNFKKGDSVIITNFDGAFKITAAPKNQAWKTCGESHLGTPPAC